MTLSAAAVVVVALAAAATPAPGQSIFDDDVFEDLPSEPPPRTKPKPRPEPQPEPTAVPDPGPPTQPDFPDPAPPPDFRPPDQTDPSPSSTPPVRKAPSLSITSPREFLKQIEPKFKAHQPIPPKLTAAHDAVIHLFHQKAVAHALMEQTPAARRVMIKVAASTRTNPSIVRNLARFDIASNLDAIKAAHSLRKHLDRNPDDFDAFELYGVALERTAKRQRLPAELIEAYEGFCAHFESKYPGWKRWGNEWVRQHEFNERKWERDAVIRDIRSAQQALANAKQAYEQAAKQRRFGNRGRRRGAGIEPWVLDQMRRAEEDAREAAQRLKDAKARMPKIPWTIPLAPEEPDPKLVDK